VGPRTGLDAVSKRKNACLCRETNSGHPDYNVVTILPKLLLIKLHHVGQTGRDKLLFEER
jgi:hypothetical protein